MREKKTSALSSPVRKSLALGALAMLAAAAVSFPWLATRAQRASREPSVNVTGVASRPTANGEVVSITADAPLSRAQTWQDEEGFHVVGYKWVGSFAGVPRGVKARRVGDSLELVVPARAGAGVTVVPHGNSLDVIVTGGLAAAAEQRAAVEPAARQQKQSPSQAQSQGRTQAQSQSQAQSPAQSHAQQRAGDAQPKPSAGSKRASDSLFSKEQANAAARELAQSPEGQRRGADARAQSSQSSQPQQAKLAPPPAAPTALFKSTQIVNAPAAAQPAAPSQNAQPQNAQAQNGANAAASNVAQADAAQQSAPAQPVQPAAAQPLPALTDASSQQGFGLSVFSLAIVAAVFLAGLCVFLFVYLKRRRSVAEPAPELPASVETAKGVKANGTDAKAKTSDPKAKGVEAERREETTAKTTAKIEPAVALAKQENRNAPPTLTPLVLFGAFRIDQEVDKLVRGEAHSIDVLASRASEDRRSVEVSLLKALNSPELIEAEKARARHALEEYGFVARQSAAVLLAPDAYGRSAAARSLGQIKSAASLPFLLEALYDSDTVVRTEVVASLGELGLPRAIGALLDVARRHPEIPPALVTDALNACSLDALDFEGLGLVGDFAGEITELEPISEVDQLPEWLEDETLSDALERLGSTDVEARVAAAHQLSQFQVRRAVEALGAMAANDRDASVRAAAITSLGLINHESVFAAILIAMADESREVRAASARALSRLNFDRADAYVRVLETSDAETLRRTAEACVTAGLARQAMDRLASEDRRQAYEAFSLLSLVARGGQTDVILHVVKGHPDVNVRLAAARLLALQGDEDVDRRLRQIAMEGNTPEKLREAIMEVCDRRRQPRADAGAGSSNESDKSLHGIA